MNNYIPPVVKNLLIINILFFIAKYALDSTLNITQLFAVYYFDSPLFNFWQPITYMFMHGDFMHIFFNMFALYSFGSVLESQWGTKRFINFYLITGLGALGLQWCVQAFEVYSIVGSIKVPEMVTAISQSQYETLGQIYYTSMVGASGAIVGLLIAFAMLYPNAEMLFFFVIKVKAKYAMPVYCVISLFLGVANIKGDSIAHFAHLGGAIIGYFIVKSWKKKDRFYNYYE